MKIKKRIHKPQKMKIHFMGVGGSGMAGVAKLASYMGYAVTGCDLEKFSAYNKHIKKGHSPNHLKNVDLLVISPAVLFQNSKHAEYQEAKKRKMVMTWQQFLGKFLLKDKKIIAVAGTHGKSTTTAMAGKLLQDSGFDPIVVLGANVSQWGGSVRLGKGEWAVVEADEFNDNFLNYHPDIIILNNIEFDHPDFFKNVQHVKRSFDKFVRRLVGLKILISQKDSLNKHFDLKLIGEHNQKNANMVYLLGKKLGIEDNKIIKAIQNFDGIERRMQLLGKSKSGFLVYDDYAHHPTAVATTLNGLRKVYKNKKIWVVLEAHGYERTYRLLNDYNKVFDSTDGVIIGPIFRARDKQTYGLTPSSIALASKHKNVYAVDDFENIMNIVKNKVKKDDILIVMGAGKSYLWARNLKKL